MHNSKIVFLINDAVRAIRVSYEKDGPTYIFKTLDPAIAVDDLVVIPTNTRHGFTVCKVTEVDIELDLEDSMEVNWIAGTFDLASYKDILEKEAEAVTAVQAAERRRKKAALRETMFKDSEDQIEALQLANHSDE